MMRRSALTALFGVIIFLASACGQTGVRLRSQTADGNLQRPARILVTNFAVSEDEVREYQGIMRQQPTVKDQAQRERELARLVAEVMAVELIEGLQHIGFAVERVERGGVAVDNNLLIDGQFLKVDEGNPLRRLVVGFGSGASSLDTQVQVYQGEGRRKLLEFTTHSDSGKLPGAAPILGAGAVAQGGITAGAVVANAAVSGVKTYRSDVERMSANSADQVVRYLSEFFVKQGWIRADQVRKARMAY
ncbi:MAG TPA: DUF4410 domain-containing protein [Candidatus Binatia bacterium]